MTRSNIALIAVDWGTTNRRAWAIRPDGSVIAEKHDDQGLLMIADRQFAGSLHGFCADWVADRGRLPIIMAGMVGSKLGWVEAPYQSAPIVLSDLSRYLCKIEDPFFDNAWIVPGLSINNDSQAEVMRGEECQVLAALQRTQRADGIFLLPGTHSKWAIAQRGRLETFRTYMTGEIFGLLRKSGTLSQLMEGNGTDLDAFDFGVAQAQRPDASNLLHSLFSVRTFGLFERVERSALASYLSGLLIGAELRDACDWLQRQQALAPVTAIGSPSLLKSYHRAAMSIEIDLTLTLEDSGSLLPLALFSLAQNAHLLEQAKN